MQDNLRLYEQSDNQLNELVSRLQDLKAMLRQENNRKEHFQDKAVSHSLTLSINFLKKQVEALEQEIKDRLDKNEELKAKSNVIDSVKSVGKTTTSALMAVLPELGKANRREIAALAGLAPYANDSGTSNKRRRTSKGRPVVKQLLFMCAMVAIENSYYGLDTFYQKLISNGKAKMVAIVAVMRKLLIIINNRCKDFYAQTSFTNA